MTKRPGNKEREKIIGAYKRLFNSPDGKLVLEDLERSFDRKTFDPCTNTSMYKQGQRSIVDLIKTTIEE